MKCKGGMYQPCQKRSRTSSILRQPKPLSISACRKDGLQDRLFPGISYRDTSEGLAGKFITKKPNLNQFSPCGLSMLKQSNFDLLSPDQERGGFVYACASIPAPNVPLLPSTHSLHVPPCSAEKHILIETHPLFDRETHLLYKYNKI